MMALLGAAITLIIACGSGWAASRIFDWMRDEFPRPLLAEYQSSPPLTRRIWAILHTRRQARWNVFALSGGLALACSVVLVWLPGYDALLAAALAVVVSQIIHGSTLAHTLTLDVSGLATPSEQSVGNRAARRRAARQQRRQGA